MKSLKSIKATNKFNKFQNASLTPKSLKQVKGGTGDTTPPIKYDENGFIIIEDQTVG